MKISKSYLILIVLLLGSLTGNSVYAQYAPGVQLPQIGDASNYDWQSGQKGFIRFVGDNESISMDKRLYSVIVGKGDNAERFRVSANGTTSILGAENGKPALNFYTANNFYLGSVGFPSDELTISGLNGIRINPSKKNKIFITTSQTTIFNPLHLSLKGFYADEGVTFKVGRNQEPLIVSSISGKRLRIGAKSAIGFWGDGNAGVNDTPNFVVKADGTVAVAKTMTLGTSTGIETYFGRDADRDDAWIGTKSANGLYLGVNNGSSLYFDAEYRNTYIGLIDTSVANIRQELKEKYRLFVAKGVLSEDYAIAPISSWSDFVFNKDYVLKTIPEVEEFISENNHLPDVPSAKQVAEEGYSQHDMNKILLQKIEELTLYTIQQQKEIQELKSELNNLKK